MITVSHIICAILCLAVTKTQNHGTSEDLVAEYYTTTIASTDQFTKQDEDDATAIWDSDRRADVIASIVMYRDKIRRYAITQKILDKIFGYRTRRMQKRYWIVDTRYVQAEPKYNATRTFLDLVYGLTYDESLVLSQYLENFFERKEKTWITIGMVLAKDLSNVIATYNNNHGITFADQRNDQKKPFKFMLRAWVRCPREAIETGNLDSKLISDDAKALKAEYDTDGWHENRDQIELILMRKSIKYSREVIKEFEKLIGPNTVMEDVIKNSHVLNADLADTYSSLARYIKDKHKYIAGLLDKYSDGKDQWAAWIMCIAVVRTEEWPKVDDAFKKDHKGDSLSKFILQKLTTDKVMAEMMALTVDSKFKPTTFSKKPVSGEPGPPATAPTAGQPTTSAPASP